jgi:hypothetical protein
LIIVKYVSLHMILYVISIKDCANIDQIVPWNRNTWYEILILMWVKTSAPLGVNLLLIKGKMRSPTFQIANVSYMNFAVVLAQFLLSHKKTFIFQKSVRNPNYHCCKKSGVKQNLVVSPQQLWGLFIWNSIIFNTSDLLS